ncbi:MAG: hypothetical protein S4CHLAM102_06830 [Chlamydiia bacterium]|nr:hypothetical protein [Chlamydiia bacterium]
MVPFETPGAEDVQPLGDTTDRTGRVASETFEDILASCQYHLGQEELSSLARVNSDGAGLSIEVTDYMRELDDQTAMTESPFIEGGSALPKEAVWEAVQEGGQEKAAQEEVVQEAAQEEGAIHTWSEDQLPAPQVVVPPPEPAAPPPEPAAQEPLMLGEHPLKDQIREVELFAAQGKMEETVSKLELLAEKYAPDSHELINIRARCTVSLIEYQVEYSISRAKNLLNTLPPAGVTSMMPAIHARGVSAIVFQLIKQGVIEEAEAVGQKVFEEPITQKTSEQYCHEVRTYASLSRAYIQAKNVQLALDWFNRIRAVDDASMNSYVMGIKAELFSDLIRLLYEKEETDWVKHFMTKKNDPKTNFAFSLRPLWTTALRNSFREMEYYLELIDPTLVPDGHYRLGHVLFQAALTAAKNGAFARALSYLQRGKEMAEKAPQARTLEEKHAEANCIQTYQHVATKINHVRAILTQSIRGSAAAPPPQQAEGVRVAPAAPLPPESQRVRAPSRKRKERATEQTNMQESRATASGRKTKRPRRLDEE